jgi:hypothetical protein
MFGCHLPCTIGKTPWRVDKNGPKRGSIGIEVWYYLAERRSLSNIFVCSGHQSFHLLGIAGCAK